MNEIREKAVRFFANLAAEWPYSNCTNGIPDDEIRQYHLLAAQAIENAPCAETKYIFKAPALLRAEDMRKMREEIMSQLDEGVLLLNGVQYVGRELEICGHKVTVELVENGGAP